MSEPSDLPAGTLIDNRYRIQSFLGRGGFASVYEAVHVNLDRRLALKILDVHTHRSQLQVLHQRFAREAKTAAKLDHPNVVRIQDFGVDDESQQPYIAMDLLEGHDLEQELLQYGPLAPDRALDLFQGALSALQSAHTLGVVHKDLKPSNLFLVYPRSRDEKLVILDFGIARLFDDPGSRLTKTNQFAGTPAYLAPEYIRSQEVSPALDVYQMGLILSESLSGRPAIEANSSLAYLMAHCNGQKSIEPALLDSPLGPILETATALEPTDRYPNAGAFQQALQQIQSHQLPNLTGRSTTLHNLTSIQGTQPGHSASNPALTQTTNSASAPNLHSTQNPSAPPANPYTGEFGATNSQPNTQSAQGPQNLSGPRPSLQSQPSVANSRPPGQVTTQQGARPGRGATRRNMFLGIALGAWGMFGLLCFGLLVLGMVVDENDLEEEPGSQINTSAEHSSQDGSANSHLLHIYKTNKMPRGSDRTWRLAQKLGRHPSVLTAPKNYAAPFFVATALQYNLGQLKQNHQLLLVFWISQQHKDDPRPPEPTDRQLLNEALLYLSYAADLPDCPDAEKPHIDEAIQASVALFEAQRRALRITKRKRLPPRRAQRIRKEYFEAFQRFDKAHLTLHKRWNMVQRGQVAQLLQDKQTPRAIKQAATLIRAHDALLFASLDSVRQQKPADLKDKVKALETTQLALETTLDKDEIAHQPLLQSLLRASQDLLQQHSNAQRSLKQLLEDSHDDPLMRQNILLNIQLPLLNKASIADVHFYRLFL